MNLGEQLRKNIEEEKVKEKKALQHKLKRYTKEIEKWICEGKTVPVIRYKDEPKLFEDECLLFLRDWANQNGMVLNLSCKGYLSERYFKLEPKAEGML